MRLWEKAKTMDLRELQNLSEEELRRYARSAVNSARERARELEEAKLTSYSEAYKAMEHGGSKGQGMFTLAGKKTKLEIIRELNRATGFLEAKTSTIEGANNRREWMVKKFGTDNWDIVGPTLDRYHELMKSTNKNAERFRAFLAVLDSDRVIDIVHRYKTGTDEQLLAELEKANYADKKALRDRFA